MVICVIRTSPDLIPGGTATVTVVSALLESVKAPAATKVMPCTGDATGVGVGGTVPTAVAVAVVVGVATWVGTTVVVVVGTAVGVAVLVEVGGTVGLGLGL